MVRRESARSDNARDENTASRALEIEEAVIGLTSVRRLQRGGGKENEKVLV
jgi:hypothetical protein